LPPQPGRPAPLPPKPGGLAPQQGRPIQLGH
jgi:hypothetical protein